MSDRTQGDGPSPNDDFHTDDCEFVGGEWRCHEACWWEFTGLDFAKGGLVVSVHPKGGHVVVSVSTDGDPTGPRAIEVGTCHSVRAGLLLQQAMLLLMRTEGSDGDA